MTIIVCGGRDYADRRHVDIVLDEIHLRRGVTKLVHGGARGADTLAEGWAFMRGVPVRRFLPEWTRYGRAAGPRRNAEMLTEEKPSLVVAFPGGSGTADMVRQARAAGVEVVEVGP